MTSHLSVHKGTTMSREPAAKRHRWTRALVVLVATLLVMGSLLFLFGPRHPIDEATIIRMRAVVWKGPQRSKEIVLDTDEGHQLLAALKPARLDWASRKWRRLAVVTIEFRDGREVQLDIFDTRDALAAFAVNSVYYRGGNEEAAWHVLRRLYDRADDANGSGNMRGCEGAKVSGPDILKWRSLDH